MTSRKKGLGKGLGALIPPGSNENSSTEGELRKVEVNKVEPNPNQPRMAMDDEKLNELVESIKEHGVVQPIVVRPIDDDNFQLIAGERRWRACKEIGLEEVPALIREYDDLEASAIALIENIQRENLNALEEAQAYNKLMSDFELTQDEISKRLGKSRPFIANMVRLLNLPGEIKDMVREGSLTAGHARALIAIKDKDLQMAAALKILKRNLNVRQTEEMIKKMLEEDKNKDKSKEEKDPVVKQSEEIVSNSLGTKVSISKGKKGKGKVVINFSDEEQLESIIQLLSSKNVSRETS